MNKMPKTSFPFYYLFPPQIAQAFPWHAFAQLLCEWESSSPPQGKRLSGKGISTFTTDLSDEEYEDIYFGKGKGRGKGKRKGSRSTGKGK